MNFSFQRSALLVGLFALCASCAAPSANQSTNPGESPSASSSASPASATAVSTEGDVKIVSSLPMTGSSLGQSQTIVNGIQQALDETNSAVCDGKVKVGYQTYDDATAAAGKWDPAQVTSNSNTIVADQTVVGVIGTF
ncbi:MAG TPA: hypothetical protein V6C65_15590, partial [Allocoleopsis sp.]